MTDRDLVPITLYLGIPQGEHADLATIAKIGLSFNALVEEIAHELFPDAGVRVEAVDAYEGSFGLNTVTKIYLDAKAGILAGARKYPTVATLAAYVALRIINNAVDWSQDQVMDWLSGKDAPQEVRVLSKSEIQALSIDIVARLKKGVAQQPADAIFKEAKQDRVITGVGVTSVRGDRPHYIVSRKYFDFQRMPDISEEHQRTRTQAVSATLISPVLAPGERRWKFKTHAGEFGAPIKDTRFIDDVLTGRANIRLKAGLVLDVELETAEVFIDGAWQIQQRSITRVYGWHNEPIQGDLLGPSSSDVQKRE